MMHGPFLFLLSYLWLLQVGPTSIYLFLDKLYGVRKDGHKDLQFMFMSTGINLCGNIILCLDTRKILVKISPYSWILVLIYV